MIALIAVFRIELNISSLIACSELWMSSSVIGLDRAIVSGLTGSGAGGNGLSEAALDEHADDVLLVLDRAVRVGDRPRRLCGEPRRSCRRGGVAGGLPGERALGRGGPHRPRADRA